MLTIKIARRGLLFLAGCILMAYSCQTIRQGVKYTSTPAISFEKGQLADTIIYADTLFQVRDHQGLPLYYYQDIFTGVCFDGKCRRLSIMVYWNVTGRYLGFELPPGEFLSKTDHEPFTEVEYERLHQLLANPELPFSNISYDQLMTDTDPNNPEVDGISGATSKAVSEIVVKGAAYTTYKLWSIVYGSTRSKIIELTEQQLTPELTLRILNSPVQTDKVWALEHINENTPLNLSLIDAITTLLSGDDFYLAYSAINAIKREHLSNEVLQVQIFAQYENAVPSIRSLILKKLMDGPILSDEVVKASISLLDQVNGKDLGDLLKLYSTYEVRDQELLSEVSKLLEHENTFISSQVRAYIEKADKW